MAEAPADERDVQTSAEGVGRNSEIFSAHKTTSLLRKWLSSDNTLELPCAPWYDQKAKIANA